MTSHLLESIISGTREMSGSEATSLTKRSIAATPSIIPSSMLTSMTCAPASTCWRATLSAVRVVVLLDQPAEPGRAGDVGALADVDEQAVLVDDAAARARTGAGPARSSAARAARLPSTASAIAAMCVGVVPQQPPTMLTSPAVANSPTTRPSPRASRRTRRTRWAARRSGEHDTKQSAMRESSATYGRISPAPSAQLSPTASGRACRTEFQNASVTCPDRVRPDASVIVPEMMTGQRRLVLLEERLEREDRRLGVERVEDRLDEQHVGAAVDQAAGLLEVGLDELVVGDVAGAGVVDVGGDGRRAVGRAEGAERRSAAGRACARSSRRSLGAGERGRGEVHLVGERPPCRSRRARSRCALKVLVSSRSAPASRYVAVDAADDVGLGQRQQVVVALAGRSASRRTARRGSRPRRGRAPWIIVPIAPSSTRMRSRRAAVQVGGGVGRCCGVTWASLRVGSRSSRISMPGSSRRVRAMSDESPPAGALRLGRVAGVPVYLDRTLAVPGGVRRVDRVADTASDLGTGARWRSRRASVVGILVAVLGHEVAHAVAARLLGVPGAPHRRDPVGRAHGVRRHGRHAGPFGRRSPAPARWPTSPSRWSGARMADACRGPASRVRLARSCGSTCCSPGSTCCPGCRSTAASSCESLVWGVTGRRDPGPSSRLVRSGRRRRRRALVRSSCRWPRAPRCFGGGSGAGHGLDPLAGATAALRRARPARPSSAALRLARGRHRDPVAWRASVRRRAGGSAAGEHGARRARHRRRCCCRSRPRPRPTSRPCRPRPGWPDPRRQPDAGVVELAPGDDAEPVLRAMATTGWGVVVVTSAGTVRGLVTSERRNAVAETVLGRN